MEFEELLCTQIIGLDYTFINVAELAIILVFSLVV